MLKSLLVGAILLAGFVGTPGSAMAAKATQSIMYDSRSVATTLWYPDKLEVIRGVLVFTGGASNGGSGDTRGLADNKFWQRFAETFGFGILGNQFTGSYTNAQMGTGQAVLDALAGLATTTKHPELVHAPLLLEGFSNGGYFSFTFAQFAPARVIAFCVNKSGFAKAPFDAPFLAVPGLLIWGSEEPVNNVPTVIHSLVQQGRASHALWAELKEWGATHEEGNPERVFAPFFAEMIAARYPSGVSPLAADVPLIALGEASGWLADHSDASVNANVPLIASFGAYKGDKAAASWLPSEALANLWRGFVTKTPITLSSPAAGTQLDATQPVQLTATGFGTGESASFLAGSSKLASAVAVSAGQAKASWTPEAGGVPGFVALAVNSDGTPTRTSRPAHVVLYGKPAPQSSQPPSAGAAAPDAGVVDAGKADAAGSSTGTSGTGAPDAAPANPAAGSGQGAGHAASGAAAEPGRTSGGCSLVGSQVGISNWAGLALAMLLLRRRTRQRV
jgi:hypothetical protein